MQRDREGIRKTERLVLQKILSFLTPLIVATAPLCLPYSPQLPVILRDTAGEKNKHNTQESINLLLCVLHSKI